jgi:RNA-binding motif X-linked protein 2
MNQSRQIKKLNQQILTNPTNISWHDDFKDSSWIYVGNIDYQLSEGDLILVFSQYGTIVDLELKRSLETGKSLGFAFILYQDQRSTILAVDNFNGIVLLGREIRVDHARYKVKDLELQKKRIEMIAQL